MKQNIQPIELSARLNSGENLRIIDVRTPMEFSTGHIPGALNIPLDKIESTLLGIGRDDSIVLVCQGGVRSLTACEKIERNYSNLWNLVGGTSAWQAVGLEVIQSPKNSRGLERQTHLVAGLLIVSSFGLYLFLSPTWIYLSLLPAFGLLLDTLTGICPMSLLLKRMPWNASFLQAS